MFIYELRIVEFVCQSVSSMEHAKNRNTLYVEISIDLRYSLSEIKISSP